MSKFYWSARGDASQIKPGFKVPKTKPRVTPVEAIFEQVRKEHYPDRPSRLTAIYVCPELGGFCKPGSKDWDTMQPTSIFEVRVQGETFLANAELFSKARENEHDPEYVEDIAKSYWNPKGIPRFFPEVLVEGTVTVTRRIYPKSAATVLTTPAYMKMLLKYMDGQGHAFYSREKIERVLRNLESEWVALDPYPIQELWDYLNEAGYTEEVEELQRLKPPREHKRIPKVEPFDYVGLTRELGHVSGKSIIDGYDWQEIPDETKLVRAVTQAIAGLNRYPAAHRLFQAKVKKILLGKPQRTEEASWNGGGILKIGIRPSDKSRQSVPFWRSILIHEMGHALEEDAHIDYFNGIYGHEPFVSPYADFRNAGEDFAETFREYNEAPRRLAKIAPEKFRDMQARVLGKRVAARYKNKKKIKNQDGEEQVVYEYSDRQIENRHKQKAEKLEKLRKGHNDLVKQVKADLKSDDEQKRLSALAVALINDTYERVGNAESAKDGHYGVTGWLVKHITFGKGDPSIEYIGKSGVEQQKTVTDPDVAKALKECCKGRNGKESIFKTDTVTVTPKTVNEYLKPFEITAKDLRGLAANREMQRILKEERKSGGKLPKDKKEREKQLKEEFKSALERAADIVGHTPSILRSAYLVPGLEDEYMKDGKVKSNLKKAQQQVVFNETKIETFRKDFLTLMKNLKRLKDYKTTIRWGAALRYWGDQFENFIYKNLLDALHRYQWNDTIDTGLAESWEKKIRSGCWGLVMHAQPPIERIEETRKHFPWKTEENLFQEFLQKTPKWEREIRQDSRKAWATLTEFFEWWKGYQKETLDVTVPTEEQVVIEGFNCRVFGYDATDSYNRQGMDILTVALRKFRERASQTYPWLLKHMLPLVVDFRKTLEQFGEYLNRYIEIHPTAAKNPDQATHVLAHEMGHHIYATALGIEQQKLWDRLIDGSTGDLDIHDILKIWPEGEKSTAFRKRIKQNNPLLYLQLESLDHGLYKHDHLLSRRDFEEYIDKGNNPILHVTTKPITGYASKNPEEAFCEVLGLLVAYGPRAVDPEIREWIKILLPSWKFASLDKLAKRVSERWAQKKTFEESIKGKKFTNPATGRKIKFESLPDEEQAKIRSQFSGGSGKSDQGKAKQFLSDVFSKINKKVAQPVIRTLGAGLGKVVGGLGDVIGKVVDRPPMNSLITVGGSKTEYGEAKNYRMMGQVLGNMFAPGSFDLTPEEEKVGKQYLLTSAQAYLPIIKGVGYSGAVKGLLGAAGLAAGAPAIVTAAVTTAVGLAVGTLMYKIIDKKWTKHWDNQCKTDQSKCKAFDELTANILNGYDNISKLEAEYEQKQKELGGQGDKLKALEEDWKKKQLSIDKAKGILSKYGSADQTQQALKKQMTEMMTWAMQEVQKGLEDGSLTDDFLGEIKNTANEIMKKEPDEIEEEAKQWC